MIKRLRVTVDGNTYDVTVEMADDLPGQIAETQTAPAPPPTATTPVPLPAPVPSTPPRVAAQSAGPAGQGDVPSPLAGRVTAVVVTAGQSVNEGEQLLTL